MLNPNAQKWVDALRSGEYKQGRLYLSRENGRHCCLGVGCQVYIKEGNELRVNLEDPLSTKILVYNGHSQSLPTEVKEWLGLGSKEGNYRVIAIEPNYDRICLAADNDTGKSFEEIAAIIESEPEGLFVTQEENL